MEQHEPKKVLPMTNAMEDVHYAMEWSFWYPRNVSRSLRKLFCLRPSFDLISSQFLPNCIWHCISSLCGEIIGLSVILSTTVGVLAIAVQSVSGGGGVSIVDIDIRSTVLISRILIWVSKIPLGNPISYSSLLTMWPFTNFRSIHYSFGIWFSLKTFCSSNNYQLSVWISLSVQPSPGLNLTA